MKHQAEFDLGDNKLLSLESWEGGVYILIEDNDMVGARIDAAKVVAIRDWLNDWLDK